MYRCFARLCTEADDGGLQWMHAGVSQKACLNSLNQPCPSLDEAKLKDNTCIMVKLHLRASMPQTEAAMTEKIPSRAGARHTQAVLASV